jgi:hypothetical protein
MLSRAAIEGIKDVSTLSYTNMYGFIGNFLKPLLRACSCSLQALLRACSCPRKALLRACSCTLKALLVMLLTYALVHVPPIRRARKVVFSQILDLRRPRRRALVADMNSHRVALCYMLFFYFFIFYFYFYFTQACAVDE